jgi:hypothetical protein
MPDSRASIWHPGQATTITFIRRAAAATVSSPTGLADGGAVFDTA